jgi:hypothetical protein
VLIVPTNFLVQTMSVKHHVGICLQHFALLEWSSCGVLGEVEWGLDILKAGI